MASQQSSTTKALAMRWLLLPLLGFCFLIQPIGCGNEVVQPTENGVNSESGSSAETSGGERTAAEPNQETATGQEPTTDSSTQGPEASPEPGPEPSPEPAAEPQNGPEPGPEPVAPDASEPGTPEVTPELQVEQGPEAPPFEGNPNQVSITVKNDVGKPVANATVLWNKQTVTTNAQGVATLNKSQVTSPYTVHVFHKSYAYFSAFGVKRDNLFVQLAPSDVATKPGKVKGTFDYTKLQKLLNISSSDWSTRSVGLGVAGMSFRANLLDIDLRVILGEPVPASLLGQSVDMPNGLVLNLAGGGKPGYVAPGQPGRRILWGFGGKFKLTDIISLIPSDPNNVSMAKILGKAKPLFSSMGFGYDDSIQVKSNTTQTKNLTLQHKLAQPLTINASNVPSIQHNGKRENLLILGLVAKVHPSFGVTPIGLTADEGTASTLKLNVNYIQPPAGELQKGQYTVLTIALTAPAGNNPPPSVLFANVKTMKTVPKQLNVTSFPKLANQATFSPSTRSLTKGSVTGASFYQMDVTSAQGRWTVLYPSGQQGFTLPSVPSGFADPVNTKSVAFFRTVVLKTGNSMDSLLEKNSTNMDNLATLLDSFSSNFVYP